MQLSCRRRCAWAESRGRAGAHAGRCVAPAEGLGSAACGQVGAQGIQSTQSVPRAVAQPRMRGTCCLPLPAGILQQAATPVT